MYTKTEGWRRSVIKVGQKPKKGQLDRAARKECGEERDGCGRVVCRCGWGRWGRGWLEKKVKCWRKNGGVRGGV